MRLAIAVKVLIPTNINKEWKHVLPSLKQNITLKGFNILLIEFVIAN